MLTVYLGDDVATPFMLTFTGEQAGLWFVSHHRNDSCVYGDIDDPENWRMFPHPHGYKYAVTTVLCSSGAIRGSVNTSHLKRLQAEQVRGGLKQVAVSSTSLALPEYANSSPSVVCLPLGDLSVFKLDGVWCACAGTEVPIFYTGRRGGTYVASFYDSKSFAPPVLPASRSPQRRPYRLRRNNNRFFFVRDGWGSDSLIKLYFGAEVVSVHVDDDAPRKLLEFQEHRIADFDVSPDGRLLLVCLYRGVDIVNSERELRLYALDSTGCNPVERARFNIAGTRCCFAPDGMTFAVIAVIHSDFPRSYLHVLDVE
jgi:hypothetical protein